MEYIASLSYGKDSIIIPDICAEHGLPLDRIVHVEIMATDTIPADLPPMMEFKAKADKIIKERYGIDVEHLHNKENYEKHFYRKRTNRTKHNSGKSYGWPFTNGPWCNSDIKMPPLDKIERDKNIVSYVGIAADEPARFHNLTDRKRSPLVEFGITESMAHERAEKLGLLSPIYTQSARGGCWFCHNQGIQQLRLLRKQYPEYWALMLKWDNDSPVTFHADGHTVHDFDRRFQFEDEGLISPDDKVFRWDMLSQELNYRWF